MNFTSIAVLALIQGAAELLPVSSSAHVIAAEKLMGLDPSTPEMTFLLVMLHTGTMFAVILYFRKQWARRLQGSKAELAFFLKQIFIATLVTGVIGLLLKTLIEKVFMAGSPHAEIEELFGNLYLVSAALAAAGALILIAGTRPLSSRAVGVLDGRKSSWIGAVQGLCLPFRGFSRSGATISTGMLLGISRELAEEFSFALAVVLTPPVILREMVRLQKAHALVSGSSAVSMFGPGIIGMVLSFGAGLMALQWLSSWLEKGRWKFFGIYCLIASIAILAIQILHG